MAVLDFSYQQGDKCRHEYNRYYCCGDNEVGYLRWTPKMRQLAKVEPCP